MAYQSKRDWQKARIQNELARNAYAPTENVRRFLNDQPMKPNPSRGDVFAKLTKELAKTDAAINKNIHASEGDKKKKGPKLSEIQKAVKNGQTIFATQPSTCFSEASFTDGVASLTFAHKTIMTVDIEMDLSEFLDFANAPEGMGARFNTDYYGA